MPVTGSWNPDYIEHLQALWREDARRVTPEWRAFFSGFDLGREESPSAQGGTPAALQVKVEALVRQYREFGHLAACVDPLTPCTLSHPLLDPGLFGLTPTDLDRQVLAGPLFPSGQASVRELVALLRETYCGSVGVEYTHVTEPAEREWLRQRLEPTRNRTPLDRPGRLRALDLLTRGGRFEEFLQKRYPGQTRFSLEGAEGMLVFLDGVLRAAAGSGVREVVLAMAHRGRLNVQVTLLGKALLAALCEFEASYDPEALPGGGDVKYHSGYAAELAGFGPAPLRVLLPENPSHLEAVNPVAEGIARALQERRGAGGTAAVLPLLVHGDASVSGQGIVTETLNLAALEGYSTGGTVHVVLDNQIGYTTEPDRDRSTRYATDVAKLLGAPVFHVHGEDPDALVHAATLAAHYRAAFAKDVFVDVLCYRRHGHNEGDEPYFTQPLLYDKLRRRPPPYALYASRLVEQGETGEADVAAARDAFDRTLEGAHQAARAQACLWPAAPGWDGWEGLGGPYSHEPLETGVAEERLAELLRRVSAVPEGFHLHPTLRRVLERRFEAGRGTRGLTWADAETLAFASLVLEGTPVRLSGEDSRRGTFSQRHAAWFDTETGAPYVPLASLAPDQAPFTALDSALSEEAVLGFEYGYSAAAPRTLVLWEAQYGDFANEAQAIFDQFVASAEAKWTRQSGLTLLLPHGYEGQGPDHSTGRIERALGLCADDNLQVCVPSTPAQYFHLLRRQAGRPFRKPLVVFTPKSLLRHPAVVSPLADLARGGFCEVLADPDPPAAPPRRVVVCAGKLYYELEARRREWGVGDVALVRLEQFYPFPAGRLRAAAERYGDAPWFWVQEEPRNMGAWRFLREKVEEDLGRVLRYVGRPEAASPATGFPLVHKREQAALWEEALRT